MLTCSELFFFFFFFFNRTIKWNTFMSNCGGTSGFGILSVHSTWCYYTAVTAGCRLPLMRVCACVADTLCRNQDSLVLLFFFLTFISPQGKLVLAERSHNLKAPKVYFPSIIKAAFKGKRKHCYKEQTNLVEAIMEANWLHNKIWLTYSQSEVENI